MTTITSKTTKAELLEVVKQLEGSIKTQREQQTALAAVLGVVILFNLLF